MTHAELLRSHADLAIKEGGMYYSGEYLSRIATVAESLEAENAKLRELVQGLWFAAQYLGMNPDGATGSGFARQIRELEIEVEE